MVLCDALRLCDHPEDEDAVEGILMKLFKPPRVSVQAAEEDYAAKFRTWGLASVPALELATVANMVAAGVPIGHALTLHSAIHVKQQVQVQQQNTDTTLAQPRQNTRAASVAEFPGLGELGCQHRRAGGAGAHCSQRTAGPGLTRRYTLRCAQ